MSTICGSFNNQFHRSCDPSPVNCATGKNNSVAFGVFVRKGVDDSSDCVQKAFQTALRATVVRESGADCINVVLPATPSRRKRSPPGTVLFARDPITPGRVPTPGDTILLASGQLPRLAGMGNSGIGLPFPLAAILPSIPTLSNLLGSASRSMHSEIISIQGVGGSLFASTDTGINGGPGAVNAQDWSTIVGALANYMANSSRQRNVEAVFYNTAGIVVMSIIFAVHPY
ncbi:hypothetical protein GP486_006174 [Trichoglossum hirsutum]|uniref:Uncharacterized protein n=1 Tax=Trichoglossum hirsutum TaxID=265104 RepID=A0A9P8IIX6_9PEZI|nr:hypothetical protein GP486_006174 [Trichoglossum hirsutum]